MSPLLKLFAFGSLLLSAKASPPSDNQQCFIKSPNSFLHHPNDFGICPSYLASREVIWLDEDFEQFETDMTPLDIDDPVAQQLYQSLQENKLDLSNYPLSDLDELQDSNWINLVRISEKHPMQITEVILPAGLRTLSEELKNGLKQLRSLQTLVLHKFNGKKLDVRGLLEEENAVLILNRAPSLKEIHVADTTQIRHQLLPPHKIQVHRWLADSSETTISTLTQHIYFRDSRRDKKISNAKVFSKKAASKTSFNQQALFADGTKIQCTHLTLQWLSDRAKHHQTRKQSAISATVAQTRFSYTPYGSLKNITQHVSPKTLQFYRHMNWHATENYLVNFSEFKRFLQAKLKVMPPGENRYFFMGCPGNHAMGLELRVKKNEDGSKKYVVNFYDPNRTITHQRLVLNEHDSINDQEQFKLQSWFTEDMVRTYFGTAYSNPTLFLSALSENDLSTFSFKKSALGRTVEYWPPVSGSITNECYFLLEHNLHQQLEKLLSKLPADPWKQYVLFAAMTLDDVPGLYMALQEGHSQAINVFVKAVLGSTTLTKQEKFELLLAKHPDGRPGLYGTLNEGKFQAIDVFVKAVLDSTALTKSQKFKLLLARDERDGSGLFMALNKGRSRAIDVFIKAVLDSELTKQQQFELLAARSLGGIPGLLMAIKEGHTQVFEFFFKAILDSTKLTSQQKFDLLALKIDDVFYLQKIRHVPELFAKMINEATEQQLAPGVKQKLQKMLA